MSANPLNSDDLGAALAAFAIAIAEAVDPTKVNPMIDRIQRSLEKTSQSLPEAPRQSLRVTVALLDDSRPMRTERLN